MEAQECGARNLGRSLGSDLTFRVYAGIESDAWVTNWPLWVL